MAELIEPAAASVEIRRAAVTVRKTGDGLVADILDAAVVPWQRIEWQNSQPGEGRTRVCPDELEEAALKLAQAVNEGGSHD